MRTPDGTGRRPGSHFGRRLTLCAAAFGAVAGCSPQSPRPLVSLPVAAQAWAPALAATHEPLSAALAAIADSGRESAWHRRCDDVFRDYLATLSRNGPFSRPELFPSGDDVLAYLVDAHVAWTLALARSSDLGGAGVAELRDAPISLDGRTTSLRALAGEIAWRAPWEPRLALFLNPGWRGGPPLPSSALEGRAIDWQLTLQAERCGKAVGFWTLDTTRKQLSVSPYTELMWGLPATQPARARRLLDVVPPPQRLLDAVLTTCGTALQRCTVVLAPMDFGRLFMPEKTNGEQRYAHGSGNRRS